MSLWFTSSRFRRCIVGSTVAVTLYVLVLGIQPTTSQLIIDATPAAELKRLRMDLLKNYDTKTRPVRNSSIPTSVRMLFDVRHIVALDEKYQTLTVRGQLMMKWTDEFLTWEPASYSGLTSVRFQPLDIWVPDVHSLYNVKASDLYNKKSGSPVLVYSNGSMKWYPPAVFDVPCSANYRHYPFDSHECSILFGAWSHAGDAIILETIEIPIEATMSEAESSEWILRKAVHTNELLNERAVTKYHMVRVQLTLERGSRIYRYICVVPTLLTLISSLFGFWLLPNETSRYLIGCSNIILTSLLLQYLAVTVPAGRDIPLLAQYSAACLCMSGAFVLVTVLTHLLRDCSGPAPTALLRLFHHHRLERYLCLLAFVDSHSDRALGSIASPDAAQPLSPDEENRRKDWMRVSLVVDRIAFCVFLFIYVILIAVLASI